MAVERLSQLHTHLQPGQKSPSATNTMSFPSVFSLEGTTALVTGGTRGIGQAMANALAEAGADIILVQVCFQISSRNITARS
jgi:phytoene dehydrogenase-like protein